MPTPLCISLLGTFQVTRGEESLTQFETDSARGLLAYLAMNPNTAFRRETLAALLWPDQTDQEASHALSQTLTRLRRAIDDSQTQPPYLLITRQTLQFNPECEYELDVKVFETLLAETRRHVHRRAEVCRPCLQCLEKAAQLYRGDFLAGFALNSVPFDEWQVVQREVYHRQALTLLYQLAQAYAARGDYVQVQHYAHRQIALEPWREEAHGQLMRALAATNERSAAMAQYEKVRQILAVEFGVEPASKTTQLYAQIRDEQFPASARPAFNMPIPLTPFIGREAELAHIAELLNHPNCRLLTLVGPSGVGKTRLACQTALNEGWGFYDGVVFVSLASVSSRISLATALAQNLGFEFYQRQELWEQVRNYLRTKEILLILDNFEPRSSLAPFVSDLLRTAPGIKILATSHERLQSQGEWVFNVRGFNYSDPDTAPEKPEDAVQFFMAQGRQRVPGLVFSEADRRAALCIARCVDGLPLALELAASRLTIFSCQEIADEIQRDFDFLTTTVQDIPEAHRSLRAVFNSTWERLSPDERTLVEKLAVFKADFDRDAAMQIAEAPAAALDTLVGKSLVWQSRVGNTVRYALHELIQRYALEKLAGAPQLEAHGLARHSHYYLNRLAEHRHVLESGATRAVLATLGDEMAHIRAAWAWALTHEQEMWVADALPGLFVLCEKRDTWEEDENAFARAAQAFDRIGARAPFAYARVCQGWCLVQMGRVDEGQVGLHAGLQILEAAGAQLEAALALRGLGEAAFRRGNYDEARQWHTQAMHIYRAQNHRYGEAVSHNALSRIAYSLSMYDEAQQQIEESLALARQGQFTEIVADGLRQLGNIAYFFGMYEEAQQYYGQALRHYRDLRYRWGESATLSNLGALFGRQGRHAQSSEAFQQSLRIKREIGDRWGEANLLSNVGALFNERNMPTQAWIWGKQALELWQELGGRPGEAKALNNLASTLCHWGDYDQAEALLRQSLHIRREIQDRNGESRTLGALGRVLFYQGRAPEALRYEQEALQIAQSLRENSLQAYALTNQGHALLAMDQAEAAHAAYQTALTLRQTGEEMYGTIDPLAGLARVALTQGDLDRAQKYVDEILEFLAGHTLEGADDVFWVYDSCVQVLQARKDPRAQALLDRAVQQLQAQAAELDTPQRRRAFLEGIPANRALLQRVKEKT